MEDNKIEQLGFFPEDVGNGILVEILEKNDTGEEKKVEMKIPEKKRDGLTKEERILLSRENFRKKKGV